MTVRFRQVTKTHPCPACGKPDWCAWTPDGKRLLCMRPDSACPPAGMSQAGEAKEGGVLFEFLDSAGPVGDGRAGLRKCRVHRRQVDLVGPTADADDQVTSAPGPPRVVDWDVEARSTVPRLSTERRLALAMRLGVTPESLEAIGTAWADEAALRRWAAGGKRWTRADYQHGGYSFPERSGRGAVVGMSIRLEDGRKGAAGGNAGARRGLVVPTCLAKYPGIVLVVEGASDVAAALTVGLPAVGRPAAAAGAAHLAELLLDREVLVVGENDRKEDGSWPGRAGAIGVAQKLATRWQRPVRWTMPPKGSKDLRAWLGARIAGGLSVEDTPACHAAGINLVRELEHVAIAVHPVTAARSESAHQYLQTPVGIAYRKRVGGAVKSVQLTNFTARIVEQVVWTNGVFTTRRLVIEAGLRGGPKHRLTVTPDEFCAMKWPVEQLGAEAIVYPGPGVRDRLRAAIQWLSGPDIPEQLVFGHVGWARRGEHWIYLHAGGAIGPDGPVTGIQVEPHSELSRYVLPAVPAGTGLVRAIKASLTIMDLGPARLLVPAYAAVWRSVLDRSPLTLFVFGSTGTFKSSLAGVLQAHFGLAFDDRSLPASWASTSNALEALAYAAKDVILTIDDFVPRGTAAEQATLHAKAERVIRGAANQQGRGRLTAEGDLLAAMVPRGLILATGEDLPEGHSLRARMLALEVAPGDIDVSALTRVQRAAAAGELAGVMSAFVRWLASRRDEVVAGLKDRTRDRRERAHDGDLHRQTPGIVAELFVGLDVFLAFAVDAGALAEAAAAELRERAWSALGQAAAAQAAPQADADAVQRFLALLGGAIATKSVHVASACPQINRERDEVPPRAEAWGWRLQGHAWLPCGERIGWTDGLNLYLDREAAYRAANRAAGARPLGFSPEALSKRLSERGHLRSRESPDRSTIKITLHGKRVRALHLEATVLGVDVVPRERLSTGAAGALAARGECDAVHAGSRTAPDAPVAPVSTGKLGCSLAGTDVQQGPVTEESLHSGHAGPSVAKAADRPEEGA